MKKFIHKRGMRGGLIQYATAMFTGLSNFVALKILQHSSSDQAEYSQLSTLLLSFTTFQIITDLGTQTEFLRSFDSANEIRRRLLVQQLLHSRLLLGITVLLISNLYAIYVRFSPEMTIAFLIYQLGFIPFAFMSVADSVFLAKYEFGKAVTARLARLTAIFSFLIVSMTLTQGKFTLSGAAAASTTVFMISGLLTWRLYLKKITTSSTHPFHMLSLRWWTTTESNGISFIRGSAIAGIFILLLSLQSFVAQGFLVRTIGETALSNFNTSMAIATPAILALQTITQMQMPSMSRWSAASQKIIMSKFITLALQLGIAAAIMGCGLWFAHSFGWVTWFFPLSNSTVVKLSLIVLATQVLLNLYGPILTVCQYRNRIKPLFSCVTFAVLMSWIAQYSLTDLWPEAAFLGALGLFAAVAIISGFFILGLHRREY